MRNGNPAERLEDELDRAKACSLSATMLTSKKWKAGFHSWFAGYDLIRSGFSTLRIKC